jgi:hypothetical protein
MNHTNELRYHITFLSLQGKEYTIGITANSQDEARLYFEKFYKYQKILNVSDGVPQAQMPQQQLPQEQTAQTATTNTH